MSEPPLILLVDDDADIRLMCRDILESAGMRVAELPDAEGLMDFLDADMMPAVILMDVMMPHSTGWSALGELKRSAQFSEIPIVLFTSHTDADFKQAAKARGVSRYLIKPASRREIVNAIYEAMGLGE